ncbi:hypothetical protein CTheo_8846 [Ceratobasidium theobromae]|uniref:Uncharacterized protein n=1 Tax=Ceratobasidium theobromae TaxID=1582974 RepID=A0A5N5Q893_9AGAM|nr:hypothetical protein CTheo_8846 [Ceratobasidium theobromae]
MAPPQLNMQFSSSVDPCEVLVDGRIQSHYHLTSPTLHLPKETFVAAMDEQDDFAAAQDLRKNIDKNLPNLTRCSLTQWCAIWRRLKEQRSVQERDRFALTGRFSDPVSGDPTRSRMDFHDHRIPDHIATTQHSDIDSVIGIVKNQFPIVDGVVLKYFMLLSPMHTLDANLHLPPILVQDAHGPNKLVEPHKVPNARFLEMEPQAIVRIFFPRLERRDAKSNCLYESEMEALYDHAVRPAAMTTLPRELTGTWPATWVDEMFRATQNAENRRDGRRIQHTGRDIHSVFLNDFVGHMRTLVDAKEELEWARSFFFVVEMRGLKTRDSSMHIPPEEPIVDEDGAVDAECPRVQSIDRILSSFHTADFDIDCWFLDIGLNFTIPSPLGGCACPLPAVEAHAAILSHVLDKDMDMCTRWVNGYGGYYQRDELAQLKALAGFRFTNPNPEDNGICYVQLYTSDKSVIYNLNLPNHAKRITTWQILENWDKARMNHFQPLIAAFREASGAHEMSVRLEVRVEFSQYPFTQLRVPDEQARNWMYWADPKDYW